MFSHSWVNIFPYPFFLNGSSTFKPIECAILLSFKFDNKSSVATSTSFLSVVWLIKLTISFMDKICALPMFLEIPEFK